MAGIQAVARDGQRDDGGVVFFELEGGDDAVFLFDGDGEVDVRQNGIRSRTALRAVLSYGGRRRLGEPSYFAADDLEGDGVAVLFVDAAAVGGDDGEAFRGV